LATTAAKGVVNFVSDASGERGHGSEAFSRPKLTFHLMQGFFSALASGDIGDEDAKSTNGAVDDVRYVVRLAVPWRSSGRVGNLSFELLFFTAEGPFNEGPIEGEKWPEELLHVPADHRIGIDAEPLFVGTVGKATTQVRVPVRHHRGERVHQRAYEDCRIVLYDHLLDLSWAS
jgi:hypothetical protein